MLNIQKWKMLPSSNQNVSDVQAGIVHVAAPWCLEQGLAHSRCLILTGCMNCLWLGIRVFTGHILPYITIIAFYSEIESFLKAEVNFSLTPTSSITEIP